MLSTAWPRKTFLSHPRNTERRSVERSFSFFVIFARIASASSPPPPASQLDVVSGVLLSEVGRVAPVNVANSFRRLYKSLSKLTTCNIARIVLLFGVIAM